MLDQDVIVQERGQKRSRGDCDRESRGVERNRGDIMTDVATVTT